jgi:hypothetical protein
LSTFSIIQSTQIPEEPKILWNLGECRQDANLDCGINLSVGRHNEKTAENPIDSLHNFTDFEHYPV